MLNGPFLSGKRLETLEQRIGLDHADAEIVEGGVVVDVRGLLDQAVIGDDDDAGIRRLLQRVRQGGAVDRGDDQRLRALGDFVLQLRELVRNVVLRILQVDGVAQGLELGLDGVAVIDPALRRLGRHQDADQALVLCLRRIASWPTGQAPMRRPMSYDFHCILSLLMKPAPGSQRSRTLRRRGNDSRLRSPDSLPTAAGACLHFERAAPPRVGQRS